jgi:hypothetical protein
MKRFFVCGKQSRAYLARIVIISALFGALSAGCTRFELEDKASAYNAAIGESNNRQILLNAVRASQRAPMSFVGFGDMAAQPTFSGGATGMWNFDPFGAVTSSVLNTSVSATGGFTNFQMSNLNNQDFIKALQQQLPAKLIQHFIDLNYPEELIPLVFVQKYVLSVSQYNAIQANVRSQCAQPVGRAIEICDRLAEDQATFEARCGKFVGSGSTITILNTAREFCNMNRFQTFVRQLRLLKLNLRPVVRTAEGMLYWLGELIAAQNYSVQPYTPEIYMRTPDGHRRLVPLFVVRRGPPVVPPAVAVFYQGEVFYIPRPELGTVEEARSLEVLDLVWWAIVAATTKTDLPKSTTVTLVNAR